MTLSSTVAEYIALTPVAKEATWLRLLLTELGFLEANDQHAEINIRQENTGVQALKEDIAQLPPRGDSIDMKGDNQGSIALAHNQVFHARTKHIDIQHHYIQDEVSVGKINLTYIPTSEMIADGLTKLLTHPKFHEFVRQMKMG